MQATRSTTNITTKIWLSIGVFIAGYVISTIVGQVQGYEARAGLRGTAEALFPAAQRSQDAEACFQRMVKGFGDAVILQDSDALETAAKDGADTVGALRTVSRIPQLARERAGQSEQLASALEALLADARTTYSAALAGSLSGSLQDQMLQLAQRTEELKTGISELRRSLDGDLHAQLEGLAQRSSRASVMAMVVFGITLLVAGGIVHLTIRRSIVGPVVRVIEGVQCAADAAAHASTRMARSGVQVSNDAEEQAAYIEETSASLEQVASTTNHNADRAKQADRLMQQARDTVSRAAQAMQELTASMDSIAASSKQVAGVLRNIDEIAFHTNILSLNASVEAARAGEAGAGFSVVADEVRSLAHRAADAARNSGVIVGETMNAVSNGMELLGHAQLAFQRVSEEIASGTQIVSLIAGSSSDQATSITAIRESIGRIESLTHRNVGNAKQTAEGAAAMEAQVESTRRYLEDLVSVIGTQRV